MELAGTTSSALRKIEGEDIDTDYFHALQSNRQYTVYGDLLKNGKCVRVEILLSN